MKFKSDSMVQSSFLSSEAIPEGQFRGKVKQNVGLKSEELHPGKYIHHVKRAQIGLASVFYSKSKFEQPS